MKHMLLVMTFAVSPAVAQTTARAPVSGLNMMPVHGAASMVMPTSPVEVTALILGVSFDPARLGPPPLLPNVAAFNPLTPTPGIPATLVRPFSPAPAPVADSPLGVIRDASANETQKAAALDQLFENSAPSIHKALVVSARPAAAAGDIGPFPATEYTNLKSAIKTRGVKAALAMQASRTRGEGRYWLTVNVLGTSDDFKKIEDLFEKDSNGWNYAGIPTDIQLRGTPIDPAASAENIVRTLAPMLVPAASAMDAGAAREFSLAPDWFDTAQLKFDALMKSAGGGGVAILRYGWRSQYEMSVFAFPGNPSVSFKEYAANPMGHPKQSLDASLATEAARREAAKILRAAQARNPVSGKDKAALDDILTFLEGA